MKTNLLLSFLYLVILVLGSACSEINLQKADPGQKGVRIKVASYCPEDGRALVNIMAFNLSSQTGANGILFDTDRDGLADINEKTVSIRDKYNIYFGSPDTNGDGYSDLVAYGMGLDEETQMNFSECVDPDTDTDRDLLNDCEEDAVGTNPQDPDTDKDGIPDGVEFRYSLNAVDPLDAGKDPDGDGMSNLEEIMANTLPYTHYQTQGLKHKVRYSVEAFFNQDNKQCYEVLVEDMPLVDVSNGNKIRLLFLEMESVQGQEQVNFLRDVTVLSSRSFNHEHMIEVEDVQNQTIIEAID